MKSKSSAQPAPPDSFKSRPKAAKPGPADIAAAERLRDLWKKEAQRRKDLGLARITQQDVADLLDVGQSAVSQYLHGLIPLNYRATLAFASVLNCDAARIRADLPEQGLTAGDPVGDATVWTDVRSFNQAVAAGDGSIPDEYAESQSLKFKRSSLQRKGLSPSRLSVFYASGDSMEPRIRDGDAVLFDTGDTKPKDGAIYVLRFGGTLLVKRLHQYGKQWFLVSDNPTDPKWRKPIPVEQTEDFDLVGRVRWIGSWED